HFAPHGFLGANGSTAIFIDGQGATLHVSGGPAMRLFYGAVIRLRNLTVQSDGHTLASYWGSQLIIEGGVTFKGPGASGADLYTQKGHILFTNDYNSGLNYIDGSGRPIIIQNDGGRVDSLGPVTLRLLQNQTISGAVVYGLWTGVSTLGGVTWDLNGK